MKKLMLIALLCAVLALTACAAKGDSQVDVKAVPEASATQAPIDLDLSVLSGTVVYSQVYDMMMEPEAYMGQRVRVRGNLTYFQDPETKREYFAAIIADATACCAQGIEFIWAGEHTYPQDYPELDTEVTVTGTFNTYEENGYTYLQLIDAEMSWEA